MMPPILPAKPDASDPSDGESKSTTIQTRDLTADKPDLPPQPAPQKVTGPLDAALPWVIEMRVVGTASTIQARVRDAMIIGRRSDSTKSSAAAPDIDLSEHNAFAHGVSRSHAMLVVRGQKLMLKDLDSTNGTRLNGAVCEPGKEYRLRHGDELMLGRLRLQVSFAVVPDEASMNTPVPLPNRKTSSKPEPPKGLKEALAANGIKAPTKLLTPPEVELSAAGSGERILIIEDDADVGAVFEFALQKAGYQVTLVPTVARGLGVIFQQMPDAIILDLLLPDMNGLDLVRYVRKQKTAKHVPMLVVSSATAGFQMQQALDAGADMFIGKPLAVEELLKAVAETLKS
jgi:CheY-like chemotaxis protein